MYVRLLVSLYLNNFFLAYVLSPADFIKHVCNGKRFFSSVLSIFYFFILDFISEMTKYNICLSTKAINVCYNWNLESVLFIQYNNNMITMLTIIMIIITTKIIIMKGPCSLFGIIVDFVFSILAAFNRSTEKVLTVLSALPLKYLGSFSTC